MLAAAAVCLADDTKAERSSSNRGVQGQHLSVLHFVKECLPKLRGESATTSQLSFPCGGSQGKVPIPLLYVDKILGDRAGGHGDNP